MGIMDPTEITKVIDGVYKNILENFNPASREMIATGKAYLKALHSASAASSLYLDSLLKLSKQAEESSLGCAADIGSSLMEVTQVFKEIHTQQLSALKAFYVDFLVPLEANLERDSRVIQNEQKKFGVSHKRRIEGFVKASANARKMKKKGRKSTSSTAIDKEIRVMQELEEEKTKLELFCENSLNTALTEERRRYGFILERQASLAKHYLAFYSKGNSLLGESLDDWMQVSRSREVLPPPMQNKLINRLQKGSEDDCIYCTPRGNGREDPNCCSGQQRLRKSKSMEGAEMLESVDEEEEPRMGAMSRAKSDLSLAMSDKNGGQMSLVPSYTGQPSPPLEGGSRAGQLQRPKSLAVPNELGGMSSVVKALYAYLSSGDNQLSFLEGDIIILIGERSKGWQYGENLRTQKLGWFPVAYTEGPESPAITSSCEALEGPMPPPPPPPLPNGLLLPYKEQGMTKSSPQNQIVSISTQTSSGNCNGRASDSLHSSNDSGFSNDIHKAPPQPEIDYSEDEPNSASGTLKSGDAWLMEKYHKSESARMKHQGIPEPRRAQSFINISEASAHDEGGHRGRPLTRSTRATRHNSTSSHRSPSAGPLQKLLSRTKSLIWKKDTNSTHPHQLPPAAFPQRQGQAFDSISVAGSCESDDLWASHASVVQLNSPVAPPPPRRPPPSAPLKESSGRHCARINKTQPPPMKVSQHSQTEEPRREPPPLPPLPPPLPWRGPKKDEKSEVSESNERNSIVLRRSVPPPPPAPMNSTSVRRTASEKGRQHTPGQRMLRVESFSASEAPIVPSNMRMRSRALPQLPRFSSGASIQSQNLEEEEGEDQFLDDAQSSIFIEGTEVEEECFPPPPPPIREVEIPNGNQSKNRRSQFENSKGSLRLLGRRMKSQSLRIVPSEPDYGRGTSEQDEPRMNYNIERNEMRRRSGGGRRVKGSIRSEVHTLELIASESDAGSGRGPVTTFQLPLFEYGRQIQKRLYYPERNSKLDQKSERTGNLCGPWYDLWGIDPSVSSMSQVN